MSTRLTRALTCAAPFVCLLVAAAQAQTPAGRAAASPPPPPRAAASVDLTGQWVSLITEDWRYRMVTPARGDYQAVPMTPAAIKVADAWDPKADEAAGVQCKSYGAPGIMHVAGRFRFTWEDDRTLRMDTDSGMQTRLFHFDGSARRGGQRTWQGQSVATWESPRRPAGQAGAEPGRGGAPAGGSLKVVTTSLRSGYLRKNGVPYSENAVLTEYFDVAPLPGGGQVMVVTVVVEDPQFLTQPYVVARQFKKESDTSKWDPAPCSAEW